MRDLGLIVFLACIVALGVRRPFLLVLGYVYVDIVQPQRFSYYLLASASISQIFALLALGGWLLFDAKKGSRLGVRQGLIVTLLLYVTATTFSGADFPVPAREKWDWVMPALVFAAFLPSTLWSRIRIEALLLVTLLSASAIIIGAGIKTVISGGGYGAQLLLVNNNTGLYEGSILSTAAIAFVPLLLWFARHGSIFRPDWRVKAFAYALVFACLLMPIGTQARTGLVCIAALGLLMLRATRRRILYLSLIGLACLAALPLLPSAFTSRMETIGSYQADESASTRLAIWAWTIDYAAEHPLGGGFDAYLQNRVTVRTVSTQGSGGFTAASAQTTQDAGRAYHSAYFEMLGEQGFPGLALWLLLHAACLFRMEALRRRFRHAEGDDRWIAPLAGALQNAQLVYLVGSLFVGIAFQPFAYLILAAQIGLDNMLRARRKAMAAVPWHQPEPQPA